MSYQYETHLHTSPVSACSIASPEEQVRAYKAKGYAGIIVTDHFVNGNSSCPRNMSWKKKMAYFVSGYEQARKEGDRVGLSVFFGFEYCLHGTEFLTYGLSPEFLFEHPDMDKLSIEQFSRFVRRHGGYLAQAHPFRDEFWIRNPGPIEPHLMDGIEVYNGGMPHMVNERAQAFAALHGIPMQSGSDSHSVELKFTSGISLEKKADNIFDIIKAIKSNAVGQITPYAI